MAMDSMKFGPEWLRNMKTGESSGGIVNSAAAPLPVSIKMAEFRYGREEMLALFDRTILPPDPLKQMQGLYVKEMQLPLALIQMTEEETRMWNRGINSDAALRLSKPGGPGVGTGGPRGAMGGRGGSVDRGRGRARGSYHYSRGLSYDDSENTNGYTRGMRNNYDRSQSGSGWGERNGGEAGDSPRKEFGSRSLSDTNWRRHRASGGEDDDGWRTARPSDKWGKGNNNSWREGEGWDRSRPWEEINNTHPPPRKPWENEESNLPEWAMENPSESGGSFDASGAFHGGTVYSDEEETISGSNHQRGPSRSEQGKANSSQPRPAQSKKEPPNITNGTSSCQETGTGDRDSSNVVPLRQSQSATSLATERRPPSLPHPITTSASFSGVNSHPTLAAAESKPQRELPHRKPPSSPLEQHATFTNYVPPKPIEEPKAPQKPSHEDEMEQRLLNDADVFVSRLMEEEDGEPIPTPSNSSPSHPHPYPNNTQSPIPNPNSDIRWVYQDPQGEIQGNFTPIEMTEWYNLGYFKPSLLVRRTGDEVFLPISEMKKFWKSEKPFEVDYHTLPPIKKNQPPLLSQSLPPAAPPAPALDESILMQYQLHQQLVHQRQQAIFARLSQSEQFNSLSALEQRQVVAHQASLASMETLQGGIMIPHLQQHAANPPTNSNVIAVLQMLAAQQQQQQQHQQLQQQRLGAGGVPVKVGLSTPAAEPPLDPIQQIMSQIGLQGSAPTRTPAPATPQNTPDDQRSFDQFLNSFRQRQATGALPPPHPQPQPPLQPPQSVVMESVWGGAASAPAFPGWTVPPGHHAAPAPPQSLWADPISKGIKTEADILEEQLRVEEKQKEELRKQEELIRLKQEEEERDRLRRIKEEEELERKRQEEEEREQERHRKRIQEAEERKKKEAAAAKKAEQDRLRKEEEKKKKEEEKRRKEEEKRKQEEEKKKVDEERKRQEEEKKKQEDMAKRQNEALNQIKEQQQAQAQARAVKGAPTPAPWTPPETTGPSLADIQKTERKQQQQLREQQEMLRVYQEKHQQHQQQQQLQLKNSKSASGLNLKWAETPNPAPTRVKSLTEIQAEEQEQMAKQQAEKGKAERLAASKEVSLAPTGSIWQTATQSLTWNNNTSTSSVWGSNPVNLVSSGGARFFDEVGNKPAAKPQAQAQAKPQSKTKAKKEEALVMKLFEKQLPKTAKTEEFNKWCTKILHDANNVDIPTFIDFLWTLESQADIQEYSQLYLDEPRKAAHFAAEFMIRRQRLLSNKPQAEVRQEPTPPPPPPSQPSNHFQEVKGKNKKVKKNKMTKVDSRILGFNVTAAPDRINVGDRDYGENI